MPSDRSRRKLAGHAEKLLEPGTAVRDLFLGRAHARVTTPVGVSLGVLGGAFVIALLLGTILIPGGILIAVLFNSIRPQRVVLLADKGVILCSRSQLTGRPSAVLARAPLDVLPRLVGAAGDPEAMRLGPDRLTFPRRERERLARRSGLGAGGPGTDQTSGGNPQQR